MPATTIGAWERRYGYPLLWRDTDGQRLYSERDIQGIIWLSDQTAGVAVQSGGHKTVCQRLERSSRCRAAK